MVGIGLIGLGAVGRLHFDCWSKSAQGKVVAIASRDAGKRAGEWPASEFNLGDQARAKVDLSDVAAYAEAAELIADRRVEVVDVCSSTPHHARLTIAALRAGKHVICEKPMALSAAECAAMEEAARESGRQLMVAHCLRYWPHYVAAHETIRSGEFGRLRYARLYRTGALPGWSAEGWLAAPEQSGGVLDMHIHDIDVALWWSGEPQRLAASGISREGLPLAIDAGWEYEGGARAQLHSAWDPNGGAFRHGFRVILEGATLAYDLADAPDSLQVWRGGKLESRAMPAPAAHQAELDDFAACIAQGRPFTRFTPGESRRAVEIALEEWRLL